MTVKILSLTPVGYYADGAPRYSFSTSYPSRGVRKAGIVCPTPEEAHAIGVCELRAYKDRDPFGNLGEVCGVADVGSGFRAVINTYHSNT